MNEGQGPSNWCRAWSCQSSQQVLDIGVCVKTILNNGLCLDAKLVSDGNWKILGHDRNSSLS